MRQFGRGPKRDPGGVEKPKFGDPNATKTMTVDKPKLPHPLSRHPHRRHAGQRSKNAVRPSKRAR